MGIIIIGTIGHISLALAQGFADHQVTILVADDPQVELDKQSLKIAMAKPFDIPTVAIHSRPLTHKPVYDKPRNILAPKNRPKTAHLNRKCFSRAK